jgi:hypothetical protein
MQAQSALTSKTMLAALIAIHAAAGLVALGAGWQVITRGAAVALYFWSLAACIALVAAAVAVDLDGLSGGTRTLFLALLALGAYMVFRGASARRRLGSEGSPSSRDLDDVGFTLIALLVAFVVILTLDVGAGGFVAAGIGVVVAAVGHRALIRFKRHPQGTIHPGERRFP